MSKIQITQLDSGVRVVTDSVADADSVALGIWAAVGTRHENMDHNGEAHMVEHMLFKGTSNRSAQDIAEAIENVGGHMNAYTSREITSYHCHLLKADMALALDVLSDMYQNYTMPDDEVERERGVILQEIGMTNDTPDDLIFDQFYETAFPGQGLGAPILGRVECIEAMQRSTLQDYISRFYTPSRTIISAAGNIDHDDFVRQVEDKFNRLPPDVSQEQIPGNYQGGEIRTARDLEQSHIVLGFQGVSRLDEDYYAAQALSTILGGGMSSRLFQEVREKRGLVYSIFSFSAGYHDDGLFAIYAGTGPESLKEVVPVICEELKKLGETLTDEEIARAKSQMRASLLMGRESMMTRADQQAKYVVYRNKALNIDELLQSIEGVNKDSLQKMAQRIFKSAPTLAALGPLDNLEDYTKISGRLAA